MYIRKASRVKMASVIIIGRWMESYRTDRGPRQRVVAWLGEMDEGWALRGREGLREGGKVFKGSCLGAVSLSGLKWMWME